MQKLSLPMGQVKGLGLDIQREPCCNAERSGSNEGLDLLSERQTAKINDFFLKWKLLENTQKGKNAFCKAEQTNKTSSFHYFIVITKKVPIKLYILGLLNSISA